jgi:hypothetical protein
MHDWRKANRGDPLPDVARSIADESLLLCFDEFQVRPSVDLQVQEVHLRYEIVRCTGGGMTNMAGLTGAGERRGRRTDSAAVVREPVRTRMRKCCKSTQ